MSNVLERGVRERVSLDDLARMCRLIITHPKATRRERAKAEHELRKVEAMRSSKNGGAW